MKKSIAALAAILILLAAPGPAWASEARSVAQARERVTVTHRARLAAERREARARYVYRATVAHTASYGPRVGRWVWLARSVGWPKAQLPTLMYVIARESGGDVWATNPATCCAGLTQIHPCWGLGAAAYDPRVNLAFALKLWRGGGWAHWGL